MRYRLRITRTGGSVEATLTEDGWSTDPADWADAMNAAFPIRSTAAGNPAAACFDEAVRSTGAEVLERSDPPPRPDRIY